jgi:hypothetical protein
MPAELQSRVFRQVLTIEVIWRVEPDSDDNGFRDWEAEVSSALRDAGPASTPPPMIGATHVGPVDELTP